MAARGVPRDHYAVLELPVTASEQDVRRAYRRLAVRWHPDKNPQDARLAELRFKEVSEAYEVLRDPVKRRQYDHARTRPGRTPGTWFDTGLDAFGDDLWADDRFGGGFGPSWAFHNPFDVFREFFGDMDPWANMRPRSRQQDSRDQTRNDGSRMGSLWSSMDNDPFFTSPSPFFGHGPSLLSQFNRATWNSSQAAGGRAPHGNATEVKIHGFSDSEEESEEERGEEVMIEEENAEDEDEELKEAIRLSLLQEKERMKVSERSNQELEEAIRRSLADQGRQRGPTDRMEV